MNKTKVVATSALAVGALMALLDSTSGPSLALLASNSTMLLILTIILVSLYAVGEERAGAEKSKDFVRLRRTPPRQMVGTLVGAKDGYTSNRREIARILRDAVDAKIGTGIGTWPPHAADSYLKSILGAQSYAEFISEPERMTARVEATKGYITRLRDVVALVGQSIGFQ